MPDSHAVNDYTALNLSKLDVLDNMDPIKICTRYRHNGEYLDYFPASNRILETLEPVYESLPGWNTSTTGIREYASLPLNARKYVERIERDLGVPIRYIGTGPDREDMIVR